MFTLIKVDNAQFSKRWNPKSSDLKLISHDGRLRSELAARSLVGQSSRLQSGTRGRAVVRAAGRASDVLERYNYFLKILNNFRN